MVGLPKRPILMSRSWAVARYMNPTCRFKKDGTPKDLGRKMADNQLAEVVAEAARIAQRHF